MAISAIDLEVIKISIRLFPAGCAWHKGGRGTMVTSERLPGPRGTTRPPTDPTQDTWPTLVLKGRHVQAPTRLSVPWLMQKEGPCESGHREVTGRDCSSWEASLHPQYSPARRAVAFIREGPERAPMPAHGSPVEASAKGREDSLETLSRTFPAALRTSLPPVVQASASL